MFVTITVEVGQGERWSANTTRKEVTVTAPEFLPESRSWWADLCAGLVTDAIYEAVLADNKEESDSE